MFVVIMSSILIIGGIGCIIFALKAKKNKKLNEDL